MYRILLLAIILSSCNSEAQTKKFSLEYGGLTSLLAQGELFNTAAGERDTYFYWGPNELTQGYIILNFHRKSNHKDGQAFDLLDSLDMVQKMRNVDLSKSNWSEEDKAGLQYGIDHYFEMKDRFDKHVKCTVELFALKKGISYYSTLTYE